MTIDLSALARFNKFYAEIKKIALPIEASYQLVLINNSSKPHVSFYQKEMEKLLECYGKKDSHNKLIWKGEEVELIESSLPEFFDKMEKLNSIQVEIPDIKINLSLLKDTNISPESIEILFPFLKQNGQVN